MSVRDENLRRAYERAQGISRHVDGEETRTHIERLVNRGWTQRQIAHAANINATTLCAIATGQSRTVRRENAAAILAIGLGAQPALPRGYIDATGARRRLQALMVLGYPLAEIARRVGAGRCSFQPTVEGRLVTIRATTAGRVARVYRQLSMVPAPPGRLAEQARNEAAVNGWHGPMAWEDIDDPECRPEETMPMPPRSVHPGKVADLVAQKLSIQQIAVRLNVSERTVMRALRVHKEARGKAEAAA